MYVETLLQHKAVKKLDDVGGHVTVLAASLAAQLRKKAPSIVQLERKVLGPLSCLAMPRMHSLLPHVCCLLLVLLLLLL
jgi:hypothetical protein